MFKSKWITINEELTNNLYMKVEKLFVLNEIKPATIKITADDYYKLYINGKYVGQGPAPSYEFNYNYNQYDITDFLQVGKNVIEVVVYYQGLINRVFVSGDGKQGLIADLYFDNNFLLGTDSSWVYTIDNTFVASKTVGYNTAFLENRDLRIKDSEPQNCIETVHNYKFCKEPFPTVDVYSVSATPTKNGNRYFYDFNQEYVCNIKIVTSSDKSDKKLTVRCGEELDENGNVKYSLRCNCDYEEICTLNQGENVIEQYDYKALRYLEIIADDGVEINNVELLVRHYPFPENSWQIETKDQVLQCVFNLCKNTVKYGTQEVFVDCPTREKGQYLGDVFISGFAHLILTKDHKILKKAITDFANSIEYSGEFLAVAPCSYQQKIADYSLLFAPMVWKYYQYTKDTDFINELFPVCKHINRYFAQFADGDGLLSEVNTQWNLVDWPDNYRDDYDFDLSEPIKQGKHNVINALYINSITSEESIKKELGINHQVKSVALMRAYNNTFFDKKTGLYVDSQYSKHSAIHSNMLPLAFDICPNDCKNHIAEYLVSKGMQCGVYMAYFYLKALCKADFKQEAYNAITSKAENSWYNMIKESATTCFEAWGKDKKWNTSLFHPWATSPIIILHEDLNEFIL